jgi:hypothetical protein
LKSSHGYRAVRSIPPVLSRKRGTIDDPCPRTVFLRATDAGLKEIYSHDRNLLAAAPHFKLKGIDVIKAP